MADWNEYQWTTSLRQWVAPGATTIIALPAYQIAADGPVAPRVAPKPVSCFHMYAHPGH
jgi:hypothetical protein